jgi:hypothetical protein
VFNPFVVCLEDLEQVFATAVDVVCQFFTANRTSTPLIGVFAIAEV